ncbi:MAG TPA: hypothetical protein PL032_02175 [Syntrophorhabdus sp.]|nr:hypothetical protein [Pseudomonadota bacterium]HOH25766.1 hypothetical protein [Syntrophorhabdus sp.]
MEKDKKKSIYAEKRIFQFPTQERQLLAPDEDEMFRTGAEKPAGEMIRVNANLSKKPCGEILMEEPSPKVFVAKSI